MRPNYVENIIGQLSAELDMQDRDLLRLYALLVLVKGAETTLRDVHDAWSLWRTETRPDHRSLIPFAELSPEVQELDRKYVEGIHRVAARLLENGSAS